jgi:antitoxin component YwqK of YwqJK toxin-antitoxin module
LIRRILIFFLVEGVSKVKINDKKGAYNDFKSAKSLGNTNAINYLKIIEKSGFSKPNSERIDSDISNKKHTNDGKFFLKEHCYVKKNKTYLKKDDSLFTGTGYTKYENSNQVIYEADYIKGLVVSFKTYYDTGEINFSSTKNKDGTSEDRYYEDGMLKRIENNKNGKKHGEEKGFYPNYPDYLEGRAVSYKANYVNGLIQGEAFGYFEGGEIYYKAKYKNGLQDGKMTFYYEDGEIEKVINYKKGLVVEGDE